MYTEKQLRYSLKRLGIDPDKTGEGLFAKLMPNGPKRIEDIGVITKDGEINPMKIFGYEIGTVIQSTGKILNNLYSQLSWPSMAKDESLEKKIEKKAIPKVERAFLFYLQKGLKSLPRKERRKYTHRVGKIWEIDFKAMAQSRKHWAKYREEQERNSMLSGGLITRRSRGPLLLGA